MKQITSSVGFQDQAGTLLVNGSLILTLPPGVYLIASGGGQVYGDSIIVNLNNLAKIPGTVTIWASDEISPQTPFNVTLCAQANGVQPVSTASWFIGGTSPIDLSLMTPSVIGPSYSGAVVLSPTGQQTINGQTLNMEGASVGFSQAGSTVADTFLSRRGAGVVAVGNGVQATNGNLVLASLTATSGSPLGLLSGATGTNLVTNWGRTTTEAEIAIPSGNGFVFTNSDLAGGDLAIRVDASARKIYLGTGTSAAPVAVTNTGINLYKTDGTTPAAIQNDGGGNVQIGTSGTGPSLSVGSNPFSAFSINPGTALVSNPTANQARRGMTYANDPAGDVTIWYHSAQTGAGIFFKDGNTAAVMAVPTGSGQLVSRTTTDTLTNKTLTGANTGNTVSVLNAQGAVGPLTGNSADQVVYTYTLPAGTVDATTRGVLVTVGLTHNSGVVSLLTKVNINGVTAVSGNIGTTAGQSVTMQARIMFKTSTTAGVIGTATSAGNIVPFSQPITGLAWASNQTISVTFNVANTDQMTGVEFTVEQIQ